MGLESYSKVGVEEVNHPELSVPRNTFHIKTEGKKRTGKGSTNFQNNCCL